MNDVIKRYFKKNIKIDTELLTLDMEFTSI